MAHMPLSALGALLRPHSAQLCAPRAADAKQQLLKAATAFFETTSEHLCLCDGKIFFQGRSNSGVPVEEVTNRIAPHMILGHGARGPNPEDKSVRTFGAQCVEVEVDVDTGEVTVLRVVA